MKKLEMHAELIRQLVRDGASNGQIREALMAKKVEVSLETVRVWVKSDPEAARLKKRSKGRPRSDFPPLFGFLPDDPAALGADIQCPSIFRVFLDNGPHDLELRMAMIAQVIRSIGIPVGQGLPLSQWTIPARVLAKLQDLEICYLAFLVSGLPMPPLGRRDEMLLLDFFRVLTLYAVRLKAKIKIGGDLTVSELAAATRGYSDERPSE
jgi:hypothetical protein